MHKIRDFDEIVYCPSISDREQIDKLKHRFHCKTDSSLFHRLIWFYDDIDSSISDCQRNVNELRSALYECLGVVSK